MGHPSGGKGSIFRTYHSFEEAYEFIKKRAPYKFLSTTKNYVTARLGKTSSNLKAIMFIGHGNVCSECWGYRKNCSNTRIGHCVEALDKDMT